MSEPDNDWPCKFDESPELTKSQANLHFGQIKPTNSPLMTCKEDVFAFSGGQSAAEDDDELTESKIRAFLDEKVAVCHCVNVHTISPSILLLRLESLIYFSLQSYCYRSLHAIFLQCNQQ